MALKACKDTPISAFLVRGLNLFCLSAAYLCAKKPMSSEVRNAYISPYNSWANRVAVHRFVQDIPLRPKDNAYQLVTDVQNSLTHFSDTPMLICWGEKDFVFDRHFLDEWIKRFPKATVHRFPESGHYILEDEGEKIIPLVQDFLKQCGHN